MKGNWWFAGSVLFMLALWLPATFKAAYELGAGLLLVGAASAVICFGGRLYERLRGYR